MRVLVIGGYGTFGGRLIELLANEPRLILIVAGRDLAAAKGFCAARSGSAATLEPARFDRAAPEEAIGALRPDIVADCAGPFQLYGDDRYRAARATLAAGAHWIDLADGIGFVQEIGALDAAAKAAGRFVLAGASSFPVLTAAVVRRLAAEVPQVETIHAGIAPSPYAGVGLNVIRAIASYAGQPMRVRVDGTWQTLRGLSSSRTMTVVVPGRVPLNPIRFALVAVPDLEVLPGEWPEAKTVWTGAGPTPAVLHRLLWLAAWLVRLRVLPSLVPLARIMDWAVNHIRWGEHRGGMIVEVGGGGRAASWHMLAEGDAGPLIPSMAIEAIVRRCLDGKAPAPGARPAHRELELADYEAMFARRGIVTGVRHEPAGELYERALGTAFATLPEPVRALHAAPKPTVFVGKAEVLGTSNMLGRLVARVFGFPATMREVPVKVRFERTANGERWTRDFGSHLLSSVQETGRGRYEGLLVERFGPTRFGMAVAVEDGVLSLLLRRWDVLGLPMPNALLPKVTASETGADDRFNFAVEIAVPLIGRLVRYRGWLVSSDRAHNA